MGALDAAITNRKACEAYVIENVSGYKESSQTDDPDLAQAKSFWQEHQEQFSFRNFTGAHQILSGLQYGSLQRRTRFYGLELHKSSDRCGGDLSTEASLVSSSWVGSDKQRKRVDSVYHVYVCAVSDVCDSCII